MKPVFICSLVLSFSVVFSLTRLPHGNAMLCSTIIDTDYLYYEETSPFTITASGFDVNPIGEIVLISSPVGLYLYDARTLMPLKTVHCGANNYVYAWSPDGSQFALYYSTCIGIEIWSAESLTIQQTLTFHEDSPYCTDPFPEEPYAPSGMVNQLAWSSTGRYLAARASGSIPTRIWNLSAGTLVISTSSSNAGEIAWSPDSSTLAYARSESCIVEGWTLSEERFEELFEIPCVSRPPTANLGIYWLSWSSANQIAVSGASLDNPIFLWDANIGNLSETQYVGASDLSWSPEGSILASVVRPEIGDEGHNDIILLDTSGNLTHRITSIDERITEIAWHPNGEAIFVLSADDVLSTQLRLYSIGNQGVDAFLYSCITWRKENADFDCVNFASQ